METRSILDGWEQGLGLGPSRRAVALSAAVEGNAVGDQASTIGRLDAVLLDLRTHLFGPRFVALATCPACDSRLELDFHADQVRADGGEEGAEHALDVGDYRVTFRLPAVLDLMAVEHTPDIASARGLLFERCVLTASRTNSEVVAAQDLPEHVVMAVSEAMGAADPQASIEMELSCPECGREWPASFDVASFVWQEVDHWARRLLWEIHGLASSYGWSEDEILRLSPRRRRLYLEMAAT